MVTNLKASSLTPLTAHQLSDREIIQKSGLFDPEWYTDTYLKDSSAGISPLDHYVTRGARMGFSPGPAFDVSYYLSRNLDIAAAPSLNPVVHYAQFGRLENRRSATVDFHRLYRLLAVSGYFNFHWYSNRYLRSADPAIDALEHYLNTGADTAYSPSPLFDSEFYLSTYPDVKLAQFNPLVHYVDHGATEGRAIRPVPAEFLRA